LHLIPRLVAYSTPAQPAMSDSEGGMPSEAAISQKLRDVVISIHKTAKPEDLTVKRVRVRAEKELSLPDGFLKKDPVWKQKSQDTILAAVVSKHISLHIAN
jgi:hypothetical protein